MTDKRISDRREDDLTASIESQTSQLPSSTFLALAGGSIAASAALRIAGKHDWALFVGTVGSHSCCSAFTTRWSSNWALTQLEALRSVARCCLRSEGGNGKRKKGAIKSRPFS